MIRRACASVMGHPFPFCIRVTVAVQPARSLFVPRGRPKPHRPVSRLSSPPRVVRCPHFPCVEERYSRIFAASASEIQSAFFPCISLMVDAHFSLVAARAVARSRPWQTLHFCSKRTFPSSTADTAGAGGGGAGFCPSFCAPPGAMATRGSMTRNHIPARKRMGNTLLSRDEMVPILLPAVPFLNRNWGGKRLSAMMGKPTAKRKRRDDPCPHAAEEEGTGDSGPEEGPRHFGRRGRPPHHGPRNAGGQTAHQGPARRGRRNRGHHLRRLRRVTGEVQAMQEGRGRGRPAGGRTRRSSRGRRRRRDPEVLAPLPARPRS